MSKAWETNNLQEKDKAQDDSTKPMTQGKRIVLFQYMCQVLHRHSRNKFFNLVPKAYQHLQC